MEGAHTSSLVQERIRRMIHKRKLAAELKKMESSTHDKEIVSATDKHIESVTDKPNKDCSMVPVKTRPCSKRSETMNSMTTNSSGNSEVSVGAMIVSAFEESLRLDEYLQREKLDGKDCLQRLSGDSVFVLSLLSKVRTSSEKQEVLVEREIIVKLQRQKHVEEQSRNCVQA